MGEESVTVSDGGDDDAYARRIPSNGSDMGSY